MSFFQLRNYCPDLPFNETMPMLNGTHALDGKHARAVVQAVRAAKGAIEWRWVSTSPAR